MRSLIRRVRAAFDQRMQAWLRRRQGVDRDPVLLHRRRIYILPTRLGIAFATMVFAMVLGGLNYNNNLGLGLAFLLVSLGLVAMHHCHGTLSGLVLRLLATDSAFAGQDVRFSLLLENRSRAARPGIEVALESAASRPVDVPASGLGTRGDIGTRGSPRAHHAGPLRAFDPASARPVPGLGGRAPGLRRDRVAASG